MKNNDAKDTPEARWSIKILVFIITCNELRWLIERHREKIGHLNPAGKLSNIEILCNHHIFGRPNFTIAHIETLLCFGVSEGVVGLENFVRLVTRGNLKT